MASNTLKLNHEQGFKIKVKGGLGGDSDYTSVVDDIARNYNNVSGAISASVEQFKNEEYRISNDTIDTVKTLSTAQSLGSTTPNGWLDYCVASDPDDYGNIGLNNNHQHLVVGYFNSNWGLHHPTDVSGLASKPNATDAGVTSIFSSPGNGMFYYYRVFSKTGDASTAWSINITGLPKSTFITKAQTYSNLTICLLYTSPSPRDQRGSGMPAWA